MPNDPNQNQPDTPQQSDPQPQEPDFNAQPPELVMGFDSADSLISTPEPQSILNEESSE